MGVTGCRVKIDGQGPYYHINRDQRTGIRLASPRISGKNQIEIETNHFREPILYASFPLISGEVVKPLRPYRVNGLGGSRLTANARSWLNIDTTSPYRAAYQSHDAGYTSRSILQPLSNRITVGWRGKFKLEKEYFQVLRASGVSNS